MTPWHLSKRFSSCFDYTAYGPEQYPAVAWCLNLKAIWCHNAASWWANVLLPCGTCGACNELFGMTILEHCSFLADSVQCLRAADWLLNVATQHNWCRAACFWLLRWSRKQHVTWNRTRSNMYGAIGKHAALHIPHTQLWCMHHDIFTAVAPLHSFSCSISITKQVKPVNKVSINWVAVQLQSARGHTIVNARVNLTVWLHLLYWQQICSQQTKSS